jgi:hypothetical protein
LKVKLNNMNFQERLFLWLILLFVCIKTLFVFSFCHIVCSYDMILLIKPDWYLSYSLWYIIIRARRVPIGRL